MSLVFVKKDKAFTSSKLIAEYGDIEHASVQRLIRENENNLSEFGKVGFEIRPLESGQSEKVFILNEQQATLIITLMKNTETVKRFKFDLVSEFYKMKEYIVGKQNLKEKSKEVRNTFTETLKNHGYCKPGHYIQTTKQMKEALEIAEKKENMNTLQLKAVMASELLAEINIEQSGLTGYHEVNPICLDCCKAVSKAIENKKQIA